MYVSYNLFASYDLFTYVSVNILKDQFFLVADDYKHQIYQTDRDFEQVYGMETPRFDRPIAIDYDFRTDFLYWSDLQTGVVKRQHLNGSGDTEIIRPQEYRQFGKENIGRFAHFTQPHQQETLLQR